MRFYFYFSICLCFLLRFIISCIVMCLWVRSFQKILCNLGLCEAWIWMKCVRCSGRGWCKFVVFWRIVKICYVSLKNANCLMWIAVFMSRYFFYFHWFSLYFFPFSNYVWSYANSLNFSLIYSVYIWSKCVQWFKSENRTLFNQIHAISIIMLIVNLGWIECEWNSLSKTWHPMMVSIWCKNPQYFCS